MSRIAIGADHAGFRLQQLCADRLNAIGHDVADHGTYSEERVDYPDYAVKVARAVAAHEADLGVLVCGSGVGVCIAANKIAGIRAATVHDFTSARLAREHNDANVVCLGARFGGRVARFGPELSGAFFVVRGSTFLAADEGAGEVGTDETSSPCY